MSKPEATVARNNSLKSQKKKPREDPGWTGEPILLRSIPDEERKTELTGKGALDTF